MVIMVHEKGSTYQLQLWESETLLVTKNLYDIEYLRKRFKFIPWNYTGGMNGEINYVKGFPTQGFEKKYFPMVANGIKIIIMV